MTDVQKNIEDILEPFLKGMSVDLVELNIKPYQGISHIQILVDHERGGISIEECTAINRHVASVLEGQPLMMGDYDIEVSSPGLDRPLKTQKDFLRVLGHPARFHLLDFIENKKEHSGRVKEAVSAKVIIQTKSQEIEIPLALIQKAVQII